VTIEVVASDTDTDMKVLESYVRSVQPHGLVWQGSEVAPHFFGLNKLTIICRAGDDVSVEDVCAQLAENELVGSTNIVGFSC